MRAVVQRAAWAKVTVDGVVVGELDRPGLVVLVGVTHSDDDRVAAAMADKLVNLRILADPDGRMNRSAAEEAAPILLISQFTLYGDTSRGRRPSWIAAAPGETAAPIVDRVVAELRNRGATVETGSFGADMLVELGNDGPVTIILQVP
ncbi:MAG TPA: D-aminoacyl-tRNA deacylase [Acidimicrobiales bacterium]|nr:D-aminoacyl-tRNA deacylase [Acidimicrobiales bacterium]